jgi:hypothetical protein
MIYTDPRDGTSRDTKTQPLKQLFGLLNYLHRRGISKAWVKVNGQDAVVQLVRAVRARIFRERPPVPAYIGAIMNTLDPPNCRCGKKGTRIFLGVTFCRACGRPPNLEKAHQDFVKRKETLANDIRQSRVIADDLRLRRDTLHQVKKNQ